MSPGPGKSAEGALPHTISSEPFDPGVVATLSADQERYYLASQWMLMWWKLKRHRLAIISGAFLLVMYASTLVSEFISPYELHTRNIDNIYAPPQRLHLFHKGEFIGPFVYGTDYRLNMVNLRREYTVNTDKVDRLRFFCAGDAYKFWGAIESTLHLACPAEGGTLFLLGTDRLGRDMLSRVIYGARISLTIGLLGITFSFILSMVIGGLAGYYGGVVDLVVQRIIEIVQSFPQIPLWMALSAILPVTWQPILTYFGITIILALLDWDGPGPRRALEDSGAPRGGILYGGAAHGRAPRPHHRPPSDARHDEPPDRLGHLVGAIDDPRRDGAQLPRHRSPSTDNQLGRAAQRSAEHQCRRPLSLADVAGGSGDPGHPGLQFLRRWAAGRGRPLQVGLRRWIYL